jgi:hypothetical protein
MTTMTTMMMMMMMMMVEGRTDVFFGIFLF